MESLSVLCEMLRKIICVNKEKLFVRTKKNYLCGQRAFISRMPNPMTPPGTQIP